MQAFAACPLLVTAKSHAYADSRADIDTVLMLCARVLPVQGFFCAVARVLPSCGTKLHRQDEPLFCCFGAEC